MKVLHETQCVVACFYGHDHDGGEAVDSHGIHHITLASPLECLPSENAWGILRGDSDGGLVLEGHGKVPSLTISVRENKIEKAVKGG
mmetsp:Transcript_8020/g.22793  ORF Transcript_8020/g.22793 Transcript_8020/m.22793 type:complete len:87 (-) Transcript_8020:2119-2379(-)